MNKFALLPVFLILFFSTKAQDRIISTHQDTIYCTILSINKERIGYELKNKDGSLTGKFIQLSQVAEYTRSSKAENSPKPGKLKRFMSVNVPESPWCLGLNVGGSTMPGYFDNSESSTAIPDYYKKLKTGFHINASAHYMINSSMGVGAEYSFFETNASGSEQFPSFSSIYLSIYDKYRQYINYVGPSVLLVQHLDVRQKFMLSESFSPGVLFLRLEDQSASPNVDNFGYTDVTNNSLFTGNSLAAKFGLTAEYRLFRNISVGLGGEYIWCSLKRGSYESRGSNNTSSSFENQKLTNAMNLSRIDYSFVLRYHF